MPPWNATRVALLVRPLLLLKINLINGIKIFTRGKIEKLNMLFSFLKNNTI